MCLGQEKTAYTKIASYLKYYESCSLEVSKYYFFPLSKILVS